MIKLCGVGFKIKDFDVKEKSYVFWSNMINRCYNSKLKERRPTYENVTVSDSWLCYDNFKVWFDEFYIEGYCLDKDLLQYGKKEKIYSPETCIFLPPEINGFLTNKRVNKGNLPTGVSLYKTKYKAQIRKEGKQYCLGLFDTIEEAEECYNINKKQHLIYLENKYNIKLPI